MKRKQIAQIASIFLLSLLITSCVSWFGKTGSGDIVTEYRQVNDFNSIELLTAADVEIVKGDSFKVEVSDYENIIEYISLKVVAHSLIISVDPFTTVLINSKAKVMITMPDTLKSMILAGSGDISIKSDFKDINFMSITGSGNISTTQNLKIGDVTASILGSGNISASGIAESVTAVISGSGNIDFASLVATEGDCTITGSGNINVYATNSLKAKISGSGNIYYYGNPTTVNSSTPGSGEVVKK